MVPEVKQVSFSQTNFPEKVKLFPSKLYSTISGWTLCHELSSVNCIMHFNFVLYFIGYTVYSVQITVLQVN